MTMEKEQLNYYKTITEKIFSVPASEREGYLAEIKKRDRNFFEQLEHLSRFITHREEVLEPFAHDKIRQILKDLNSTSD